MQLQRGHHRKWGGDIWLSTREWLMIRGKLARLAGIGPSREGGPRSKIEDQQKRKPEIKSRKMVWNYTERGGDVPFTGRRG